MDLLFLDSQSVPEVGLLYLDSHSVPEVGFLYLDSSQCIRGWLNLHGKFTVYHWLVDCTWIVHSEPGVDYCSKIVHSVPEVGLLYQDIEFTVY